VRLLAQTLRDLATIAGGTGNTEGSEAGR
jgi:hypothetical protein